MTYAEGIIGCNSIDDIIDYCHQQVPMEYKAKPWTYTELNHGVDLLHSEEALNCYMSAYGEMHTTKCRAAMMNFPFERMQGSIEIVDWGCGQGIGSATIVEILKEHDKMQWLRKITLIEPSENAINRAYLNLCLLTRNSVEIDAKNMYLPINDFSNDNTLTAIGYRYDNIIHIFSNILDVKAIDLGALARMVASAHGLHFVLCIGPKNNAAYRIEKFCSVFVDNVYFSSIDSVSFAHTKRTGHSYTCMTRCFVYNGASIDLGRLSLYNETNDDVLNDYDLFLKTQNGLLSLQKARVAWRLENILSVDDKMYVDAVLNEVKVDFIIIRPNKGILIINLFEENLDVCKLSDDCMEIHASGKKYQSPFDLVSLCYTSIKDGIEELLMSTIEDSRNFSVIKKVVIFTENTKEKIKDFFNSDSDRINYTYFFGKEFIENRNISLNLYNLIGFLHNNSYFDDVIVRKLIKILSPSWHSYQEGRVDMHPVGAQRGLVISAPTQQKISGVAGSGKTQVLAFRAINAMKRTGGDVLILTYNITLANYLRFRLSEIRDDFSWEKIDIYPYHQFFRIRAAECQLRVEFNSYQDETFFSNVNKQKKYSAIFVDEVQDFTSEWLRIIMHNFLIDPNDEFVVFGDPRQNVYHRPLDANNDIRLGVIGGQWNRSLTTGRRFTNPRLANLAFLFQTEFMSQHTIDNISVENVIANTFNFQITKYIDLRRSFTINTLVDKIINIVHDNYHEMHDFVVLASTTQLLRDIDSNYRQMTQEKTEKTFVDTETYNHLKEIHNVTGDETADWRFSRDFEAIERTRKQKFTTERRCLKISTIQSFKGWESTCVIFILEDDHTFIDTLYQPMAPETIYTAITRARESLYVINIGNNTYHNFFNSRLL